MAISDKLNYLLETKQAIKQAIIDKGQEVADTDTFRSYAEKIEAIEAGSSGGSGGAYDIEQVLNETTGAYELRITDAVGGEEREADDPVKVYKETRPKDWLNMMGTGRGENYDEMETYYDTYDNEIRLLFHLSPPNTNLLAFQCATSSGTYNVSYTKANSEVVSTDIASGSTCELTLDYDDFGNETGDGIRQVLIVIKPTNNTANLLTFNIAKHSAKTNPSNYMNWNVVEFMGKCTDLSTLKIGSTTSSSVNALHSLKYFSLFDKNNLSSAGFKECASLISILHLDTSKILNMSQMFIYCFSLIGLPKLDTSSATDMSQMFQECRSLISIPQLDTSNVTNMLGMFNACSSLKNIPYLDTSKVTDIGSMFYGCYSLKSIPQLDTSSVTSLFQTFYLCRNLTAIPELNLSSVTSMGNMFQSCYALTNLTITATDWAGKSFSIIQCSLDYEALLNLLGSLPPITGTATATLTNNIGTAQLSAEVAGGTPPAEYTQAVANGWTIAL